MKKIILLFLIPLMGICLRAEKMMPIDRPLNNVSLNLVGDASLISLNYERLFFLNDQIFLSGLVGLGYNEEFQLCLFGPCDEPPEKYLNVNFHLSGNFGKGRHFLEVGLGTTFTTGTISRHMIVYPLLGYRLQPFHTNKIHLRIFASYPIIGLNNIDLLYAPFGVAVGISL